MTCGVVLGMRLIGSGRTGGSGGKYQNGGWRFVVDAISRSRSRKQRHVPAGRP